MCVEGSLSLSIQEMTVACVNAYDRLATTDVIFHLPKISVSMSRICPSTLLPAYRPTNAGTRFSKKLLTPSIISSEDHAALRISAAHAFEIILHHSMITIAPRWADILCLAGAPCNCSNISGDIWARWLRSCSCFFRTSTTSGARDAITCMHANHT